MSSARFASAALACFLCVSIQLVQVHADCKGHQGQVLEADIQLLLNCTTQNPKAQLLFGLSLQDSIGGYLVLEFNCSYGNMISTGRLLERDAYPGSSSLQTPPTSQIIPWGARCVFSGCYEAIDFVVGNRMFSIPPTPCTLHNRADVKCAVNCSEYSMCVGSRCECLEGLVTAEEGQSCFNLTDCRYGNCYQCTENGTCGCWKGFEPVEVDYGLLSCRDINECSFNNGGCEQECVNTVSSFLCACSHGYVQLENGTCRRNSVTTTQPATVMDDKVNDSVLLTLLLIPIGTLLLVVGVVVGVVVMWRRKRMELHRFGPRMEQKLVDDLLIDITTTTFVDADDESVFDHFLPSPTVYSWSSMPELVDDIHRYARKFSTPDDRGQHVSEPDLVKKMFTLPAVTRSSMPELVCSSQQFNTSLSRVSLSDPRNVTQLILDLPNQEDEYIVLSEVS